jgi:hypothetical protein
MKESKQDYYTRILELYVSLPHTPERPRRPDRQLVSRLYDQGIPGELIESAMLLAVARRLTRPPDALPLPTIRSMYYFIPVLDELRVQPLPADYADYLRGKVDAEKNKMTGGRSPGLHTDSIANIGSSA